MKRRTGINQGPAGPSPSNHEVVGSPVVSTSSGILPTSAEPEPQPSIRFTDQQILTAVERWFLVEVNAGYRHGICEEARHQVARYPSLYLRPLISKSLRDLIEEARPTMTDFTQSCDYINSHIEWLLAWMLALRHDPTFVYQAIGQGYASATKSSALQP
jgi:hypothetical protein